MTAQRRALVGGQVLWPDGRLAPGTVVLDGSRIESVLDIDAGANDLGPDTLTDVTGCVVAPGFIDTHVHGGLGVNFMAAETADIDRISGWLAGGGVTACLATTASVELETVCRTLHALSKLCGPLGDHGVDLVGIHLEGPFLSPDHRGVHRTEFLVPPMPAAIDAVIEAAGGKLRVVTLAPELPGGFDAVVRLAEAGVRASVGHSSATYAETKRALELGADRATHLFNALPSIHHRQPGPLPALLTDPQVDCELVADGVHVAPEMIRFAVDVVGVDRILLVSDGTDVAGLPAGRHSRWEGTEVMVTAEAARTITGGVAGSVRRLADAVQVSVQQAGIDLAQALRMASTNPARSLGLTDRGRLSPGTRADLVVLGPDLEVRQTLVCGDVIFSSEDAL